MGKPEGKRPLGRPKRRSEYNIKLEIQEGGCENMDWLRIGTDGGGGSCKRGNEPSAFMKCGEFLDRLRTG